MFVIFNYNLKTYFTWKKKSGKIEHVNSKAHWKYFNHKILKHLFEFHVLDTFIFSSGTNDDKYKKEQADFQSKSWLFLQNFSISVKPSTPYWSCLYVKQRWNNSLQKTI